ncbi:MAG TPA: hypothetical protein VGH87_03655, partial [Polyangiaceae bacterium]
MGDVSGISNGNYYSDRDLDTLQGNEKVSNAAVNRVANHAGASEIHVLHGRDKTEGESRSEHRDGVTKEGAGSDASELATMGVEHIIEHVGEVEIYEMMKSGSEDGTVGRERAEAMPRDAMHALILGSLNGLP